MSLSSFSSSVRHRSRLPTNKYASSSLHSWTSLPSQQLKSRTSSHHHRLTTTILQLLPPLVRRASILIVLCWCGGLFCAYYHAPASDHSNHNDNNQNANPSDTRWPRMRRTDQPRGTPSLQPQVVQQILWNDQPLDPLLLSSPWQPRNTPQDEEDTYYDEFHPDNDDNAAPYDTEDDDWTRRLPPLRAIWQPDYGGLVREWNHHHRRRRSATTLFDHNAPPKQNYDYDSIDPHDARRHRHERRALLAAMDHAADVTSEQWTPHMEAYEDREFDKDDCRPPAWQYVYRPNCLAVHEGVAWTRSPEDRLQDHRLQYLGSGYFREAYLFSNKHHHHHDNHNHDDDDDTFVVKPLRLDHAEFTFGMIQLRDVLREAVVLNALASPQNPLLTQLYGHCGTTTVVQAGSELEPIVMPEPGYAGLNTWQETAGMADFDTWQPVRRPHWTATRQLATALQMATALATLHGAGIVHDDVRVDQWMVRPFANNHHDGTDHFSVFLNDVNNARVLSLHNTASSSVEYCDYDIYYPSGDSRPREAYWADTHDHHGRGTPAVDVWQFGGMLHVLTTGLRLFHESDHVKANRQRLLDGQLPNLTVAHWQNEGWRHRAGDDWIVHKRLYELLTTCCLHVEPADRWSIFAIVEHLRETERLYQEGMNDGDE